MQTPRASTRDGIAIVGLAGRFPGAPDVATFWRNLCDGVESICELDEAHLADAFDPATRAQPNFVRARGLLEDTDLFDNGFFGMHAREAALTDPQHRVLLETCWQALEDAGCDPATATGAIGIYAGCSIGTYLMRHVLGDGAAIAKFASDYQVGSFPELLGGGNDFVATRIAYKLDLRGPAMTVQSACSTGLLAVAQACHALHAGQADVMLAGAASITFPQERGYLYEDSGMVSSDGRCRSFDAAASGTVFGAGAGVVVLKRLADALAAGDSIYAVIRGVGVTNDGSGKAGFTAPSVNGQAAAISAALEMAGFTPGSIDYIECHGTGTPLGDPIEIAGLAKAFAPAAGMGKRCAIGSVKPNIGHLDVAAGMASLIKTALAIRHGKIPPSLHFRTPNPHIDFAATPFYVNAALCDWPGGTARRRAGVSAFGVGGTNVHAVLEAAPRREATVAETQPELLVVSARSDAALSAAQRRLAHFLRAHPDTRLGSVARTLQSGRRAFPRRFAVAASSPLDAAQRLEAAARTRNAVDRTGSSESGIAFLFPGQGAQYVGMGRGLYATSSVFREAIDRCADIVRPLLGRDLLEIVFAPPGDEDAMRALTATSAAQPALFAIEYALSQLWKSWGIEAVTSAGHSVGEFVAATLAGVFTLEDALRVVTERGRLMQALPPGAMLAVWMSEAELAPLLGPELGLASVNSPAQAVAAGPIVAIAELEAKLVERGAMHKRVATSHAFHSPMMDPIVEPLERLIATMTLSEPATPYVSTVTGTWITAHDATSPAYWAAHARRAVRFAEALQTLTDAGVKTLLETGPGSTLTAFARQGAARGPSFTIVPSLPAGDAGDPGADEWTSVLEALGELWTAGARPKWDAVRPADGAPSISLPTYPFERTRHWIDEPAASAPAPARVSKDEHTLRVTTDHTATRALAALIEELSGESFDAAQYEKSFLELGFDSLFLGRFAQRVNTTFGSSITFRQLLNKIPSLAALAEHLAMVAPGFLAAVPAAVTAAPAAPAEPASAYEAVVREQLRAMQDLFREQLRAVGAVPAAAAPARNAAPAEPLAETPSADETRFDAFRIGAPAQTAGLTAAQQAHIDSLVARVTATTAKSKAYAQRYRSVLADPRVAAGFRSEWKEMVYPLVCARAAGSKLWDIDGNEYVDILNGFGQIAFGHAPDFVVAAVNDGLERGFAIGPQTDLAGEVAELFCTMTGNERVTFCNTGSEAVMAALRIARTVTGRDRIVVFAGSYHGQFDEVLVKGARGSERSIPVAAGIPAGSVSNVTVLAYGAPESLTWIREHALELAAVVVEPVQSRHPALAPAAFVHELRAITQGSGTALVFDEVVTGFRMHPAGMQAAFGVRADLATYGKVVGGGMPIGILAGTARFMDALDGGMWRYGDDSVPEVSPTFFAGTFVRHPLVMSAVLAVLRHLEKCGPKLQEQLTARTAGLVRRLNGDLERRGLRGSIETYGSLFYFDFSGDERLAGLLYYHLRLRGCYVQEGFPCFLTTAHSDADLELVARAFSESLDELQAAGIFTSRDALEIPLTESQKEVWLAAQFGDEASCAFNESVTLRLQGHLDSAAFGAAFGDVVARHESLRASFGTTGESMRISPTVRAAFDVSDLRACGSAQAQAIFEAYVKTDAATPFDLECGPLVRSRLFHFSDDAHAFVLTAHHIACDGWSINVILRELGARYTARVSNVPDDLPVPLAFVDYAARVAARDASESKAIESYWHAQFADPVRALEMPTDRPRREERTFSGASRSTHIDRDRYFAIRRAGARGGCTLFVTLFSAFSALVGNLARQTDVVVAIPAAGQALIDGETLVGHCVDFLPVRMRWDAGSSFADLLASARARLLDAYEHQSYTFGTLVRTLAPARTKNRRPLTDLQFNLERLAADVDFKGLRTRTAANPRAFVNFDMSFNVVESDDGLRIDCDYNRDLFDETTIDRWIAKFTDILDSIVANPDAPAAGGVVLASGRTAAREAIGAQPSTVPELFEAGVALHPGAAAAVCGDESVTYEELDARANRFANYLLAQIPSGSRVAVVLDRSIEMLVALLGTLKAGCAYVPLDPHHPAARLKSIIAETGAAAIVAEAAFEASLVPSDALLLRPEVDAAAIAAAPATRPEIERRSSDLAYVIYTSGSTGLPKGVEVEHGSVVNLLASMRVRPGFDAHDRLLAVTTISFDIAALELFLPLAAGGTVVIARREDLGDGHGLVDLIRTSGATAMQATPSLWRILLEAGFRAEPDFLMLCGGEALRPDVASRLLEGSGELWNMYGPTETTIWSTCARIESARAIDVGTPIANTQCYVLNERDEIVPVGTVGQLHIAGAGVARGYSNAPAKMAQNFVPNPFGPGRMYRTGDSARVLESGAIDIVGRIDDQVKIRGHRVELGEIETVLSGHPNLAASAVMLREDTPGEQRLVGYFIERAGGATNPASLARYVAERLPDYMVPALWMRLEALPLTSNGKLNRAGLPAVAPAAPVEAESAAAHSATELALLKICREVLRLDWIDLDTDLFALGADSIQIFAITARANRLGKKLLAKHLFAHRTIAAVAKFLDTQTPRTEAAPAAATGTLILVPRTLPLSRESVNSA